MTETTLSKIQLKLLFHRQTMAIHQIYTCTLKKLTQDSTIWENHTFIHITPTYRLITAKNKQPK